MNPVTSRVLLSERTTLRLGGPAHRWVVAPDAAALVEAVTAADAAAEPLLVLGGGSNLVVADRGFEGLVVQVASRGITITSSAEPTGSTGALGTSDRVLVTAQAGEVWDGLVATVVAEGLAGVEALSGIPGLVGATPIQNVGAYGQEVAQTIVAVTVLHRDTGEVIVLTPDQCAFAYRTSIFKGHAHYVVLSVSFGLDRSLHRRRGESTVRYAELARALGVEVGAAAPVAEIRAAVLTLRQAKGMVLDAADHDTWSAGSFFTNPILSIADAARLLPADAPRWPAAEGQVKTSAAWLIEHAGFTRGYGAGVGGGAVRVSRKHTLALTNRGGATTEDLLTLAREIRDGVLARFGVALAPEPVLLGCTL